MKKSLQRLAAVAVGLLMGGTALTSLTGVSNAAAAPAPIEIGVICSCTGPLATGTSVGPPIYQAWVKWQNSHGGINGHQVAAIVKDDASNPTTSLADAQELVTQDHVVALVDSSDVDSAWAAYAQKAHVPVVGGGSFSAPFVSNPDFFAVGQTPDDYYVNFLDAAKKVGAKNVGELYCAESASCQQGVAPLQATAADLGMTVGYVTQISYSAPNFTAQCLAAKEAGVQAMIIADASTVVDEVATDCVKQGYTPYFMELDGGVATSFTTTPGLSDKFIGSEPNIPFFLNDTPGTKTMNTALKKYAASTYSAPSYNEEGTQLWVSGLLFTAAATASKAGTGGPVTSAEILKGLYALHGETLGGMAPPLTFHKGKPSPVDCWYWIRIQHGKFTTPYGTAPTCVEPPAT